MKYLFFILLSFNAFAEFKVEVKNLQGVVTHGAEFKTSAEADAWITSKLGSKDWGEEERLKPTSECSSQELAIAIDTIPPVSCVQGVANCIPKPEMKKLPKMYSTSVVDITAQKDLERADLQDRLDAKERLKALCSGVDAASTVAALRAAVKSCLVDIIKANKN